MAVQVVSGGIGSGAVLETVVSDADLRRAHAAAEPEPPADGEPAISPEVKAAYDTAKSAAEAQYAPNRRRAEARRQREGDDTPALEGQTTITDFWKGA